MGGQPDLNRKIPTYGTTEPRPLTLRMQLRGEHHPGRDTLFDAATTRRAARLQIIAPSC